MNDEFGPAGLIVHRSSLIVQPGAWTVVVADLNGDGRLDAATRCVEARRLEVFYGR